MTNSLVPIKGALISKHSEIHPDAKIGTGTTVWSFTVIERDVEIGNGVVIGSHCFIGAGAKIGEFSRVQTGVFIPRNTVIEDHVFIGPHVVMTDDKHPICGTGSYDAKPPVVRAWASIGAGAVILPGITIGSGAMVGAGAVVTRDVPASDLVVGLPARTKIRATA